MQDTTTTTHTPGPWEIVKDRDSTQSYVTYRIGRAAISTEKGVTCSNSSALMSVEEAEANARLIAAAPDLLEALQDCLALMVNGPDGCADDPIRIETVARAAIAKAEGGAA